MYERKIQDMEGEAKKARKEADTKIQEELQQMREMIQHQERSIEAKSCELDAVKIRDEEIQQKNRAKDDLIEALTSKLETMREEVKIIQEHNQSLLHELQTMKERISTKDDEISERDLRIKAKDNEISVKCCEIRAKAVEIEARDDRIKTKEDEIRAKDGEIEAKEVEIRSITEQAKFVEKMKNEKIAQLHEFIGNAEKRGPAGNLNPFDITRALIKRITDQEIGNGAWGVVSSGTFLGERVAIKQAHKALLAMTTIDMLKREVRIMSEVHHPNLVKFIGAVFDNAVECGKDMPIIVLELMDMNLREAYRNYTLSNSLISIFSDVAYAIRYLHERSQPIIHRDLSAPNVLLRKIPDLGYVAKVSDFGSANIVRQAQTAGAGAIIYAAPEMFPSQDITAPPKVQTIKVDVFSYGILVLEVLVKKIPTERHTLLQQVDREWNGLIVHCTKVSPSDRPTMADILKQLSQLPHPMEAI
jgi:serine/threonine protein kinase